MGLQIIAVSKAKWVSCSGGDECGDAHWPVGRSKKRRDGLKSGCYVTGRGGRDMGFSISWNGYGVWIEELSKLVLGIPKEEVWKHPRRYRNKPFVELIDFPDTDQAAIGPRTAAKLYADFAAFAATAKKHYLGQRAGFEASRRVRHGRSRGDAPGKADSTENESREWMWEVYCDFRRAFRLARNDGLVTFC